jgi:uncharacterized protein (TIGR03435 family)
MPNTVCKLPLFGGWRIPVFVLALGVCSGLSQYGSQHALAQGGFVLPPVPKSEHASHTGPTVIVARQFGFPAEIAVSTQNDKDWLNSVQVTSRTRAEIISAKVGWAYVLASGLDFHEAALATPNGGVSGGGSFWLDGQGAAPRTDAKDFVAFVEQVTFDDKTEYNADHAKIADFYSACCTPAGKAKAAADKDAAAKEQAARDATPGGSSGTGPKRADNLKPITFDVVSFRRADHGGSSKVDMPADGDFIAYHGQPINQLIVFAYGGLKKDYFTVSGEPAWATTDLYEFQAKVAHEDLATWKAMTLTDKRYMMRTLLEDVLKLKVHEDVTEHAVYNLVVAKGGPKLTEYQPGDALKTPWGATLTGKVLTWVDPFHLVCQDETMADLVNSISGANRAGRVVIDKTELKGTYNFSVPIPYAPLPAQLQQMGEDQGVPSIFDGLKQLGLQLVPGKGPIDGIVVDHMEKPAEN